MASIVKSAVTFGVGFASGWAARSLSDSPQGVGVRLLEIAMNAKERVGRWASVERERLEDMVAEARANAEPAVLGQKGARKGSGAKLRAMNGQS